MKKSEKPIAKPGTIAAVKAIIFADSALSADQARLLSELFADMYQFAVTTKKKK